MPKGKKRKAAATPSKAGSILAFFQQQRKEGPCSPPKQLCDAQCSKQSSNRGGKDGEGTEHETKRARHDNHPATRSPDHPIYENDKLQNPDSESPTFETHKKPGSAKRGNGSVHKTPTVPFGAKPRTSLYFKRTAAGQEGEQGQVVGNRSLSSKLSRTFLRSRGSSKGGVCMRLFDGGHDGDGDDDDDGGKLKGETEVESGGQPSGSQKENAKAPLACHREQSAGSGKKSDAEDVRIDLTKSDNESDGTKQSSKLSRSTSGRKKSNYVNETLLPKCKEAAAHGSPGRDASESDKLREPPQSSETKQDGEKEKAGSAAKITRVTNTKSIADKSEQAPFLRKPPPATTPLGTDASRVPRASGVTNSPKAASGSKANRTSNERRSRPPAEKAARARGRGEEEPAEDELGDDRSDDDGPSADAGEGRHDFYLENFMTVLSTVMGHEHDRELFNDEDLVVIGKFYSLSEAAQKLYVRLFQRKLRWMPTATLEYTRIAADLTAALDELINSELLQSEAELTDVSEALSVLPAPELRSLARAFHVTLASGVHRRQLVEALARLARQRSVLSLMGARGTDANPAVLRRAHERLGRCVRVRRGPRAVFSRVMLLFSPAESPDEEEAASGGQSSLLTLLMVGMVRLRFPAYTVHRQTRIFPSRDALLRYEAASHILNEMDQAMSTNRLEDACSLYRTAHATWDEMKRSLDFSHEEALPLHLRCMSAGWAYTRMMSRGVEILQRLQFYREAVEQLRSLLSQQTYCVQRRGSWWDRLALNLQHHLKDTPEAIEAIRQGLTDPHVRTGYRLALHQRAVRIRDSPSCKALRHLLRDLPTVEYDEAPKVTIRGKPCPQTGMGKSIFLREEEEEEDGVDVAGRAGTTTVMCSVEELALAHYRSQGFDQGLHGEGGTFCTLFGLLLWDVIFSDTVPDVFLNPYQGFPLDLYTDGFYENRRELLDKRLAQLRGATSAELQEMVAAAWNVHEGEACGLVSWERLMTLGQATSLVASLGGHLLAGVCERLAKSLRHCRGGLPDLVVWSSQTLQCKLVEVKGPNDRLSQKQLLWLHELMRQGAQVEVCHVTAYGARAAARLEN